MGSWGSLRGRNGVGDHEEGLQGMKVYDDQKRFPPLLYYMSVSKTVLAGSAVTEWRVGAVQEAGIGLICMAIRQRRALL